MQKILPILSVMFMAAAVIFPGCEKDGEKETILHDTVYIEYDIFTYQSTGEDENGDMVIFTDPNYPDYERYELFLYDWEYFNEIKVDNFVFVALSTGSSLSLLINGEKIGQSMAITDDYGEEWQYLELSYNTTKKADVDVGRIIRKYREERGR